MISTHAREVAHVLAQHVVAQNEKRLAMARGVAVPSL